MNNGTFEFSTATCASYIGHIKIWLKNKYWFEMNSRESQKCGRKKKKNIIKETEK